MSEWKRHRGSESIPKCLEGKSFQIRYRDGTVADGGDYVDWVHCKHRHDVMAYRILPSEPAAEPAKPDYSNGFPDGATSDDIGARIGDKFLVVNTHYAEKGEIVTLVGDDGSIRPLFDCEKGRLYLYWANLAPFQQKTAIELQAEEVGIHEPVRHVAGEWIEWNGGECPVPKGTLVDVKYRDGSVGNRLPANINVSGLYPDAGYAFWLNNDDEKDIFAYRLHQPQEIDTEISHITPADVSVTVDIGIDAPKSAPEFLQSALSTLTQRGNDYDKPEGVALEVATPEPERKRGRPPKSEQE